MQPRSDLIVSVSGIRGVVGEGLTPDAVLAFARALGTWTQGGKLVVSRDGRSSGDMLRHAVVAGLLSAGCAVEDLGVLPTPTVGVAIRKLDAAGGIQITASHNPAEWNGLKLFGPDGAVLSAQQGQEVLQLFRDDRYRNVSWEKLQSMQTRQNAGDWHLERVQQLVDVPLIRSRQFRVLLDANGGAGGPLGRDVLDALGCRPTVLGGYADGDFAHTPEPTEENLRSVAPKVVETGAAVGCALDPDADRLALIDERGRYIGEELTLALAVLFRLEVEKGPVVINMSTSRVTVDLCERFGVPCHRAAVGEANVVAKMHEVGAVLGGEGNGGVIDPRVGFVRDPFIGMGLILNLMAVRKQSLSEIVATLPVYHIVKTKHGIAREQLPGWFAQLQRRWPEATSDTLDGLRLDWPKRWLHVRPSNTEPIVRIIAEAPTEAEARQLCQEAAAVGAA